MKEKLSLGELSVLRLGGIDNLGRKIHPIDGFREDRKVGIFYFFWAGQEREFETSLFDIQKLIDSNNTAQLESEEDFYNFYYCGEPIYGYYNMQDKWVLKRHMELLTLAGIDFICIDCTNVKIYTEVGKKLFAVMKDFISQGFNVPKITFYTNSCSGTTVKNLYDTYYKSGEYDELWYRIDGKPLIMGVTENNGHASDQFEIIKSKNDFIAKEYREYFTVKESQWPSMYDLGRINDDAVPWMSWRCPQYVHNDGYVAVPVAQHGHPFGKTSVSLMLPESSRGYNNYTGRIEKDKVKSGLSYQQMWDSAIDNKEVKTAFICGFNEWMAQKQGENYPPIKGQFVDVYNHEFSRDIEPMKGGYNDNFYIQTAINIRRFKGITEEDSLNKYKCNKTININALDIEKEFESAVHFKDFKGDTEDRDFLSSANENVDIRYVDRSGRNDITDVFVASDKDNLYVLLKTHLDITKPNICDKGWMNLYLGLGEKKSFHGFNYLVNRKRENGLTSIEKYNGKEFEKIADVNFRLQKNCIAFSIPLRILGVSEEELFILLKATDNVTNPDDIMNFYCSGDSAPIGRFGFYYGKEKV